MLVAGIFLSLYGFFYISSSSFYIIIAMAGIILAILGALRLVQESRVARSKPKKDSTVFVKTIIAGELHAENKILIKELSKDLQISHADLKENILRLIDENKIAGTVDEDTFFPNGEAAGVAEILVNELNKTGQIKEKIAKQEQAMVPKTDIATFVDFKSVMLGMAKAEGKVNLAFLSKKFGIKLKPMKKKIYGLIGSNQLAGRFEGDFFYPSMEIAQAIDKLFDEFSDWGSEKKI